MKTTRLFLPVVAAMLLGIPASAQETWKPIGTGLFRENFVHAFYMVSTYPEVEVEIMESEQTPGRYRIMNPYADYPDFIGSPGCYDGEYYITVDASDPERCYVEQSNTGYMIGDGQVLMVSSIAYDMYMGSGSLDGVDATYFGKLVDGAVTFPAMALLAAAYGENDLFPSDEDFGGVQCDYNGMFRLKLPGAPDLDVAATLSGIDDARTELTFEITLGKSVEKALVALVAEDKAANAVADMLSGAIESKEITASGATTVPYTGDGMYTLVVIPFLDGEAHAAFTRAMEISYDESEWRKTGTAMYTEGIISGVDELIPYGFIYPSYEYRVEVEENVSRPGYIRLVDAYGLSCPLSGGNVYDDSRHWYIYIDATDPDAVVLEQAEGLGLDLRFGVMDVWSKADRCSNDNTYVYYGSTPEVIRQKNWYGLFADDEITFPQGSLSFRVRDIRPDTWYEANSKGNFSLKFEPGQLRGGQSGVESVAVDKDDATAEYFRIDGTPVKGNPAPGIYIVRKGKEVNKIIIR